MEISKEYKQFLLSNFNGKSLGERIRYLRVAHKLSQR